MARARLVRGEVSFWKNILYKGSIEVLQLRISTKPLQPPNDRIPRSALRALETDPNPSTESIIDETTCALSAFITMTFLNDSAPIQLERCHENK
jgi:hypothetical protein